VGRRRVEGRGEYRRRVEGSGETWFRTCVQTGKAPMPPVMCVALQCSSARALEARCVLWDPQSALRFMFLDV
jgi:hypothetical protein